MNGPCRCETDYQIIKSDLERLYNNVVEMEFGFQRMANIIYIGISHLFRSQLCNLMQQFNRKRTSTYAY